MRLATGKFKSISLSSQTISIVGDVAIVRHRFWSRCGQQWYPSPTKC